MRPLNLETTEERKLFIAHSIKSLKHLLVPYIFSKGQFEVLIKKLDNKKLTKTEQRYWYGQIRKKIIAHLIFEDLNLRSVLKYKSPITIRK